MLGGKAIFFYIFYVANFAQLWKSWFKFLGIKTSLAHWLCQCKLWQILLWRSGTRNIWFLLGWFCWLVCFFYTSSNICVCVSTWWSLWVFALVLSNALWSFRYIEASKERLYQSGAGGKSVASVAQAVLLYTFENILKVLHPFMPFVTEELWQVNLVQTLYSASQAKL